MVAVSVAISLMLQNKHFDGKHYNIKSLKHEAQSRAVTYLQEDGFKDCVSTLIKGTASADPKCFVRGGPFLTMNFLVYEGREDPNTTNSRSSSACQGNAI